MEYTTQMDAARKGIATPQMKAVAEKEHMPLEQLMELVAKGQVAICANKAHTCLDPQGVGSMLRTKINVNPVSYTHLAAMAKATWKRPAACSPPG